MTNSKTRLRVARIAAAAVFAAGASLTAIGTASALDLTAIQESNTTEGTTDGSTEGGSEGATSEGTTGVIEGVVEGLVEGQQGGTDPEPEPSDPEPEPSDPEPEPSDPEPEPSDPEPEPSDPEPEPSDPEPEPSTPGEEPASSGGSGGGSDEDDPSTCVLDEDSVNCGTDTDSVGTKPISQEKPKEELAETGAAETTFLLIGAATMIAGGVAFRLMPRMAGRRTAA
ncbi:hypothetical protein [Streptomyces macrosporus]|uniref:LPXTG cell wall anchor domain-containing protein n=1 Tax=Streptomyces macrosporus TaxID=44032 RepID=A0ABN3KMQ7_9ACTN